MKSKRKYVFTGLTLTSWATQAGKNPQTMEKMFRQAGLPIEARRIYTVMEFQAAITGDERAAKVLNMELDAKKKAREEKIAEGSLMDRESVQKAYTKEVNAWRTALDAAPPEAVEWRDKVLYPAIRAELEVEISK